MKATGVTMTRRERLLHFSNAAINTDREQMLTTVTMPFDRLRSSSALNFHQRTSTLARSKRSLLGLRPHARVVVCTLARSITFFFLASASSSSRGRDPCGAEAGAAGDWEGQPRAGRRPSTD